MLSRNTIIFLSTCVFILALGVCSQVSAAGKIIAQGNAIEAENITVFIPRGSHTGSVRVTGCAACPITLTVDGNTQFFHRGEPARARQVSFLSGKPGTVIFDKDEQRAIRIRW